MREHLPFSFNPQPSIFSSFRLLSSPAWRQWGGGMVGVRAWWWRGSCPVPQTHTHQSGEEGTEQSTLVLCAVMSKSKVRRQTTGLGGCLHCANKKVDWANNIFGIMRARFLTVGEGNMERGKVQKNPEVLYWCWCWYEFIETHLLTFIDFPALSSENLEAVMP